MQSGVATLAPRKGSYMKAFTKCQFETGPLWTGRATASCPNPQSTPEAGQSDMHVIMQTVEACSNLCHGTLQQMAFRKQKSLTMQLCKWQRGAISKLEG